LIEISKLSDEHISQLGGAYLYAALIFGTEPIEATKSKQRKIRKWITNQYIELVHELPEQADVFSVENSDRDVLLFLKECAEAARSIAKEKENKFESDFATIDESARTALIRLADIASWPKIARVGNDIKIITDNNYAFRTTLTLKNADAVPTDKEGYFCYNLGMALKKEQNRFCFYGELEDPEDELLTPFALTFDNAEAEIKVYNACSNVTFAENPWRFLHTICFAIGMKADLPGDYCNAKEKELLPLIKEIVALEYCMVLDEQELFSFSELKSLAHQYEYSKVETMLGKLETIKPCDREFYKTAQKLIAVLCEKQYEPLWREIFNKIAESQAEYPNSVDSLCDKERLISTRNDIQSLMEAKGYIGSYPDFVKDGTLDGIHLESSYNVTYFVGMEKHAQYHIHCCEATDEDGCLTIQFLCATALLKNSEAETDVDVYDCLFNAKGRRLFHTVWYPLQQDAEEHSLESSVSIAVKKAECIKLTKAERKEYYGSTISCWSQFLWVLLIAGGMFGIAMTVIGILFCILAAAVFGLFADIPEMLRAIPWGLILAIGWIGFGGAMGIVEVLANRK